MLDREVKFNNLRLGVEQNIAKIALIYEKSEFKNESEQDLITKLRGQEDRNLFYEKFRFGTLPKNNPICEIIPPTLENADLLYRLWLTINKFHQLENHDNYEVRERIQKSQWIIEGLEKMKESAGTSQDNINNFLVNINTLLMAHSVLKKNLSLYQQITSHIDNQIDIAAENHDLEYYKFLLEKNAVPSRRLQNYSFYYEDYVDCHCERCTPLYDHLLKSGFDFGYTPHDWSFEWDKNKNLSDNIKRVFSKNTRFFSNTLDKESAKKIITSVDFNLTPFQFLCLLFQIKLHYSDREFSSEFLRKLVFVIKKLDEQYRGGFLKEFMSLVMMMAPPLLDIILEYTGDKTLKLNHKII